MSSISPNLPRAFCKLSTTWNKRAGTRSSCQGVWSKTSSSSSEPINHVPAIMSGLFEDGDRVEQMAHCLFEVNPKTTTKKDEQIWIYNMRNSDAMPRTQQDTQKLYSFVRSCLSLWCDRETNIYLEKNIHISVCFFVWYFTTPSYFYIDNVITQTTRKGVQRIWTPLLLNKEPKTVVKSTVKDVSVRQKAKTTDVLLPKHQTRKHHLCSEIETLVGPLEWSEQVRVHLKISGFLSASSQETHLSIGQKKKLQKLYNEYTELSLKIKKTNEKINKTKILNSKIATSQPEWAEELGPPPKSTNLIRENADTLQSCSRDCLAQEDADVPDSWEDNL